MDRKSDAVPFGGPAQGRSVLSVGQLPGVPYRALKSLAVRQHDAASGPCLQAGKGASGCAPAWMEAAFLIIVLPEYLSSPAAFKASYKTLATS